jgi:gamma-glutamylcyclotransferase
MKYFAYGSNMSSKRMKEEREIVFTTRRHAVLRNYSLRFNKLSTRKDSKKGEGKGNIICDKAGIVEGVLYDIEPIDRNKLDCFEGYPFHYERIYVIIRLDDGSDVEAFTYIAQPDKVRDGLRPSKKYLGYYLEARDVLSDTYYEMLESWLTVD